MRQARKWGGITGPARPAPLAEHRPAPLAEHRTQASVYATGLAFLTCWVKAACGDDGDLLGAPRALSAFESQDLSLESGSRGVRARPKPSSVSAMVRPGSCARARFYSEDKRESWRVSSDIGDSCLTLHSKLKEASESLLLLHFPTTHHRLRNTRFRQGGGGKAPRISPARALGDKRAVHQICLNSWKSQ